MILEVPEKRCHKVKLSSTGRTLRDRFGGTFGDHFCGKLAKTWLAPSRWYQGGIWAPDQVFKNWRARYVRRFALPCSAGYCLVYIIARSASYVRRYSKTHVSVRPFVRKIIDFCREYMNPGHVLEAIETLKSWFWRLQKKHVIKSS